MNFVNKRRKKMTKNSKKKKISRKTVTKNAKSRSSFDITKTREYVENLVQLNKLQDTILGHLQREIRKD